MVLIYKMPKKTHAPFTLKEIKDILVSSGFRKEDRTKKELDTILMQLAKLKYNPRLRLDFEFYTPVHRASFQKQGLAVLKEKLNKGKISKKGFDTMVQTDKMFKVDKHLDFIEQAIAKVTKHLKYGDPIAK